MAENTVEVSGPSSQINKDGDVRPVTEEKTITVEGEKEYLKQSKSILNLNKFKISNTSFIFILRI